MKKIIFVLLTTFLVSCSTEQVAVPVQNKPRTEAPKETTGPAVDMKSCICPHLWMPVCGEDKRTYSNACFAKCANVSYTQGSCTKQFSD